MVKAMRRTRTALSISAACLFNLSVAGCGNSMSNTDKSPTAASGTSVLVKAKNPVTLTFVIANTVDATPFNKIFKLYEAKSGNKVELQALPGGDFDNMIKTRFSTGDFPDLFLMQPGTKQNVKLRAEETLREWSGD